MNDPTIGQVLVQQEDLRKAQSTAVLRGESVSTRCVLTFLLLFPKGKEQIGPGPPLETVYQDFLSSNVTWCCLCFESSHLASDELRLEYSRHRSDRCTLPIQICPGQIGLKYPTRTKPRPANQQETQSLPEHFHTLSSAPPGSSQG